MHTHIYRKRKWMRWPFLCFCRQRWAAGEGGVQRFGDSHRQLCLVVRVGPSVAEKDGPIPYQSRKREGREVQKASRWPRMMTPTIILMADQTVNDEAKSLCSVGSHRVWGPWETLIFTRPQPCSGFCSPSQLCILLSQPLSLWSDWVNYCFIAVPFAITYIFSALLKCFKTEFSGSRVSFCFCAIQGMRREFCMSVYVELRGAFNIVCCLCFMKRLENNQSKRILKHTKMDGEHINKFEYFFYSHYSIS